MDVSSPQKQLPRARVCPVALLVFFGASLLTAGIGESTAIIPDITAMFWLPVGILMALLLVSPPRQWPAWIATSSAAELTANLLWWDNHLLLALGYASANVIHAMAGATLLRRFLARPAILSRPTHTGLFVVLCGLFTPMISATIIGGIDWMIGKGRFLETWQHVWLGDSAGVLVGVPLTLVAIGLWRERRSARAGTVIEVSILATLLSAVAVAAFEGWIPTIYLTLPLLMWAAMRFQLRGALPALFLLVVIAAIYALGRDGLFANLESIDIEIVNLQVFFAVSAISALFAAVLAKQHEAAKVALRHVNQSLEQQVAERTARLATALRAGRLGVIEVDRRGGTVRLDPMVQGLFGQPGPIVTLADLAARVNERDRTLFTGKLAHAPAGSGTDQRDDHKAIECRIGPGEQQWIVIDLEPLDGRNPDLAVGIVQDVTERMAARRRQRLLIDELSHRVKNTLSVVQAIAMQTLGGEDAMSRDAFLSRIAAFARAHDLLARQGWEAASLEQVIDQALAPFGREHFSIWGEMGRQFLPASRALTIALALHELATNSSKYGALSVPGAEVTVRWELHEGDGRFRIIWAETGGPEVVPPSRRGFGSVLLERVTAQDLRGTVTVEYRREGVVCVIDAPMPDQCPLPADLAQDDT